MMRRPGKDREIFRAFRQGEFYEDLYQKFDIDEQDLIHILQRNVKGNYDYSRILSGGIGAQLQFIRHLNHRWNPLDPDASWESVTPYTSGKKIPAPEEEDQ
ncbi:MAG: hypothetical protein ACTSYI_13515 [Promethearchaeota archaeon]